jgi:hypothetical protein
MLVAQPDRKNMGTVGRVILNRSGTNRLQGF